jgi:hypothetical protein
VSGAPAARRSGLRVVALALLGWGLGHVAMGDRRGWLLLALEAIALVLIIGVGLPRIEGDAVDGLFLAIVLFFALWIAQAVHAHGHAVRAGAAPGGAMALLLLLLPVAAVVFSAFWMVGGSAATASAAVDRYVEAWRRDRPGQADRLLLEPAGAAATQAAWTAAEAALRDRLGALAASLGPASGIDLDQPFANLEFRVSPGAPPKDGGRTAVASIVVVRHVTVHSTFLGLFPTAVQEVEVLDTVGRIELASVPLRPSATLLDWPATNVWRVVSLGLGPSATP